jgi:hydroxymethyl cephem carbamoyltransferase
MLLREAAEMRVLAFKPGHDGHIAHLVDGVLEFSIEAEKNSGRRYAALEAPLMLDVLEAVDMLPDAFALSGWTAGGPAGAHPQGNAIGAGYDGIAPVNVRECAILGMSTKLISSSHERSHIFCAYALSPFAQGTPCHALVWEGHIGAFYAIDTAVQVTKLADIMCSPGIRYAFAYALCDPSFDLPAGTIRLGDAGKLMALAAYGDDTPLDEEEQAEEEALLQRLLGDPLVPPRLCKADFRSFRCFDCGVESALAKRLARRVSRALFSFFEDRIRTLVTDRRPLLIGGGCGLNGAWNRAWLDSGLFADVFVPPCANDSGSAIGTGVDAQFFLTGNAKLKWDVYAGASFDDEGAACRTELGAFRRHGSDLRLIAALLEAGAILGWVSGRCEMGPRALGNRSIIAAPFSRDMQSRLNAIKQREPFRPIAPMCLEEDAELHFDLGRASPHMLFLARVKTRQLAAVTHVDGTARVQTVRAGENAPLHRLLTAFKVRTGFGVLCNTSLNFNGAGFINRTTDLVRYATDSGLDGFVIDGELFVNGIERFEEVA